MIVNKPDRWYHTLETILVYPAAFKSRVKRQNGALVTEHDEARSGESWDRGPVVLSWSDTAYGASDDRDGHNVVYHEFAHQLDQQTGVIDGAPLLDRDHAAGDWAQVFQGAYKRMLANIGAGRPTVLNPYGATAPAEFFAVATEHFFEQPQALKAEEPTLYAQLTKYFEVDPVSWG